MSLPSNTVNTHVLDRVGIGDIAELKCDLHSVCAFVTPYLDPYLRVRDLTIVPCQPVCATSNTAMTHLCIHVRICVISTTWRFCVPVVLLQ